MTHPRVVAIYIGRETEGPMEPVDRARAVAGMGLEGDRYYDRRGTFNKKAHEPDREITLIEVEALEALAREDQIELDPSQTRRNLLTRDVPLNHLVGREFRVGGVTLRGIRLCEPCGHLESLTRSGVRQGLIHRGGLRAQVLSDGEIRPGDAVRISPESGE
jgi:MOSC domain-containing protein YiiM